MKKRLVVMVVLFALVLTILVGCSTSKVVEPSASPIDEKEESVRIAIILGTLGDMGFADEAYQGMKDAKEKLGIEFDYVEISEISEVETQLRMLSDTEEYDLIILMGATYMEAIKAVAPDYLDQKFSLVDATIEGYDNIHSSRGFDPEQTFLSGVIAGLVTQDERMPSSNKENIIGFIGGMDNPISRSGAAGFMAGAKYVNPNVEFIYNIVGGYRDPSTAKEMAMTAYGRGADVISHNAGGSGMGVFSAAEEADKYIIGSSRATVDPERSLVTSLKRTDLLVFQEVESIVNNTWKSGISLKGLKEGICDYDMAGINTEIPTDIIETVEAIKKEFLDGKFTLPTDPNDIPQWSQNNQFSK